MMMPAHASTFLVWRCLLLRENATPDSSFPTNCSACRYLTMVISTTKFSGESYATADTVCIETDVLYLASLFI